MMKFAATASSWCRPLAVEGGPQTYGQQLARGRSAIQAARHSPSAAFASPGLELLPLSALTLLPLLVPSVSLASTPARGSQYPSAADTAGACRLADQAQLVAAVPDWHATCWPAPNRIASEPQNALPHGCLRQQQTVGQGVAAQRARWWAAATDAAERSG